MFFITVALLTALCTVMFDATLLSIFPAQARRPFH